MLDALADPARMCMLARQHRTSVPELQGRATIRRMQGEQPLLLSSTAVLCQSCNAAQQYNACKEDVPCWCCKDLLCGKGFCMSHCAGAPHRQARPAACRRHSAQSPQCPPGRSRAPLPAPPAGLDGAALSRPFWPATPPHPGLQPQYLPVHHIQPHRAPHVLLCAPDSAKDVQNAKQIICTGHR